MKNPQTSAERLFSQFQSIKLKSIKDWGCCAFVLMWCLGKDFDDIEAIITLGKMMDRGVIGADCTVYWNEACKYLTGKSLKVEFKEITSLKGIKEKTPVRFDYKGKSHWVGVENGRIKFNSLEESNCVKNGKPATARILHIGD